MAKFKYDIIFNLQTQQRNISNIARNLSNAIAQNTFNELNDLSLSVQKTANTLKNAISSYEKTLQNLGIKASKQTKLTPLVSQYITGLPLTSKPKIEEEISKSLQSLVLPSVSRIRINPQDLAQSFKKSHEYLKLSQILTLTYTSSLSNLIKNINKKLATKLYENENLYKELISKSRLYVQSIDKTLKAADTERLTQAEKLEKRRDFIRNYINRILSPTFKAFGNVFQQELKNIISTQARLTYQTPTKEVVSDLLRKSRLKELLAFKPFLDLNDYLLKKAKENFLPQLTSITPGQISKDVSKFLNQTVNKIAQNLSQQISETQSKIQKTILLPFKKNVTTLDYTLKELRKIQILPFINLLKSIRNIKEEITKTAEQFLTTEDRTQAKRLEKRLYSQKELLQNLNKTLLFAKSNLDEFNKTYNRNIRNLISAFNTQINTLKSVLLVPLRETKSIIPFRPPTKDIVPTKTLTPQDIALSLYERSTSIQKAAMSIIPKIASTTNIKTYEKENNLLTQISQKLKNVTKEVDKKNKKLNEEKEILDDELDLLDRFLYLLDLIAIKTFYVAYTIETIGRILLQISQLSINFFINIIKSTEELVVIERRLTSLYQNIDKDILLGIQRFEELNLLAIKSVYTTQQLVEGFTQFKAIGLDNIKIFKLVVDTATAFGYEVSRIADDVARALEGDAQAFKNLRASIGLTNQNIKEFGGVLDSTGRLILSQKDALEKNRQAVINYLKQYEGMAEKTVGTLPQQIKNLEDAFKLLQLEIVKTLDPLAKLIGIISELIKKFNDLNETTKSVISTIISLATVALATISFTLGSLFVSIGYILQILSGSITTFTLLGTSLVFIARQFTTFKDILIVVDKLFKILETSGLFTIKTLNKLREGLDWTIKKATWFIEKLPFIISKTTQIIIFTTKWFSIITAIITVFFLIKSYSETQLKIQERLNSYITQQSKEELKVLQYINKRNNLLEDTLIISEEFARNNNEIFKYLEDINNQTKILNKLYEETGFEANKLVDIYIKLSKKQSELNKSLEIDPENIKKKYMQLSKGFIISISTTEKELRKLNTDIDNFFKTLEIKPKGTISEITNEIQNLKELAKIRIQTIGEEKIKELQKDINDLVLKEEQLIRELAETPPTALTKREMLLKDIESIRKKIRDTEKDLEQEIKFIETRTQKTLQLFDKLFERDIQNIQKQFRTLQQEYLKLLNTITSLTQKTLTQNIFEYIQENIKDIKKELQNIREFNITTDIPKLKEINSTILQTDKQIENVNTKLEEERKLLESLYETKRKQKQTDMETEKAIIDTQTRILFLENKLVELRYKQNENLKTQDKLLSNINQKVRNIIDTIREGYKLQELVNKLNLIGLKGFSDIEKLAKDKLKRTLQEIDKLEQQTLISFTERYITNSSELTAELKKQLSELKTMIKENSDDKLIQKKFKQLKNTLSNVIQAEIVLEKTLSRFNKLIENITLEDLNTELSLLNQNTQEFLQRRLGLSKQEADVAKNYVGFELIRIKLLEQVNFEKQIEQEIERKIKTYQEEIKNITDKNISNQEKINQILLLNQKYQTDIKNLTYQLPFLTNNYLKQLKEITDEKLKEFDINQKLLEQEKERNENYKNLLINLKKAGVDIRKLKPKELGLDTKTFDNLLKEIESIQDTTFTDLIETLYQDIIENKLNKISEKLEKIKNIKEFDVEFKRELEKLQKQGIKLDIKQIYELYKKENQKLIDNLKQLKDTIEDFNKELKDFLTEQEKEQIPEEFRKYVDFAKKAQEIGKQINNTTLIELGKRLEQSIPKRNLLSPLNEENENKIINFMSTKQDYFQFQLAKQIQQEIEKIKTKIDKDIKDTDMFQKATLTFNESVNKFNQTVDIFQTATQILKFILENNKQQINTPIKPNLTQNPILKQLFSL